MTGDRTVCCFCLPQRPYTFLARTVRLTPSSPDRRTLLLLHRHAAESIAFLDRVNHILTVGYVAENGVLAVEV